MTTATLNHTFVPYGTALDLFHFRGSELLLSGPAGTGKSRACLEKLHAMALANPKMRGLIVRKTRESLGSTALVTWREHVVPEALQVGVMEFYGGSAEQPPQYRYENGSTIAIGGMDKATKIMSSEYDVAYAQEAIELSEDDWESITTRLRNGRVSFQQLIADTNPSTPQHWLKQRADRGDLVMLESRHEDNPVLFNQATGEMTEKGRAYLATLDKLTGVRKLRLRKGLWVSAEGLIHEDFDPAHHLLDRFEVPQEWRRIWSVDFGFTNPFVLQMWAQDPDGRLYLVHELYRTKRLVEDHARDALALMAEYKEPKPEAVICDHDAEDRATLERHLGMKTTAAYKGVSAGIQAVQSREKPASNGIARIFILRNACHAPDDELIKAKKPTCTADEIPGYVWADHKTKEQPVKQDDHGCDARRYAVAYVDNVGKSAGIQDVDGFDW